MGKRHAAAAAGIAQAQSDERLREAIARRESAERERQLLTSYLGSREQVEGTGRFSNATPEVLKYTQRYSVDQRALADVLQAGSQVKRQEDPFQGADNRVRGGLSIADYGQGFANRANELLGQAEAAARAGDFDAAERLYAQAQAVIGGVSSVAQDAYNLGGGEASAAAIRASSAEGRIVGRQLLVAGELQDPNSATTTGLRGRLLDPTLSLIDQGANKAAEELDLGAREATSAIDEGARQAQIAIDENLRNAERAIAAERSQIEGEIRQRGQGGGVGLNSRAQLALQSRVASTAALQRAQMYGTAASQRAGVLAGAAEDKAGIIADAQAQKAGIFSVAGAQKAAAAAQVNVYLNEFAKRMAEDSVRLSQEWVDGSAGVRDEYQAAIDQFDVLGIQIAEQRARILFEDFRQIRQAKEVKKQALKEGAFGVLTGAGAFVAFKPGSTAGEQKPIEQDGPSSVGAGRDTGVGDSANQEVGEESGASSGPGKGILSSIFGGIF